MNPLDAIQRVAEEQHKDLYLVFGDIYDFNRAVVQEYELTYPAMFVIKSIQPRGFIYANRYREVVNLQIFFMLNPERLDMPVGDQREKVESMAIKARMFLYDFLNDEEVKKRSTMPDTYNIDTIYYNQDFTLYGVRLRFDFEYDPDYSIC